MDKLDKSLNEYYNTAEMYARNLIKTITLFEKLLLINKSLTFMKDDKKIAYKFMDNKSNYMVIISLSFL